MESWYETWFNSKYYHLLYQNRDDAEAEYFLKNLFDFLTPLPNSKILDLACGKGRHSIFLNKKGFNVTGIDLSPESISCAKNFENKELSFFVHDMRHIIKANYFDYVLNLFTSLGYFENEEENEKAIDSMATSLKVNGTVIIDFFNSTKTSQNLIADETKTSCGVNFKIKRWLDEKKFINKKIEFNDNGKQHQFIEKVKAYTLPDFENMLHKNSLKIIHLFGNYSLEKFDKETSDRLIIIATKIS